VSDIDTVTVDSLKALDSNRPIREADIHENRKTAAASGQCALRTVFPKVISGLRKPIAIQAAISLNMNLPE
jgi:hypothetical protein